MKYDVKTIEFHKSKNINSVEKIDKAEEINVEPSAEFKDENLENAKAQCGICL